MKPEQAWQAVRGQLQSEMPKATFDTWVRDADLISVQDNYFIVGVQNGYARDWLESRLTQMISRLLTGVQGSPCEVRFVVAQDNSLDAASSSHRREERLHRAFATTMASLRTQVSLTDYETRLKHIRVNIPDAKDAPCKIITPDPETLLWVNTYLRPQFDTLFSTSFGEDIPLQFTPASVADTLLGDTAEETISLYTPLVRLRDIFFKDSVGHRYPRYLLRWIPYIGTNAFWTLLAMRQAHFELHHCLPENGRRIQVSLRSLAASIGADKNTIQSHRDSGALDWFIEHIPTERYQVVEAGKVHREAHAYIFHNVIPFTPSDQTAVHSWLTERDFGTDPLGALDLALKTAPRELLAAEIPSQDTTPSLRKPKTLQNSLLSSCEVPLSTTKRAQLLRRIEELQSHIIEGLGYDFISLYFMKHWVPRLGHSAAAFVLLCRQNIYVNEDDGEYREFLRFPGGQAGLEPYAQLMGKSLKTLKRLLPPVEYEGRAAPGRKTSHRQNEINRAASRRIQDRKQRTAAFIYRAVKKKNGALMLYIKKRDPLIPDHQREYDACLLLVSHFLGKYGLDYSDENINTFLASLNELGVLNSEQSKTHVSDIDISHNPDITIPHISDMAISHESDIEKAHVSDDSKTHYSDNGISHEPDIDIAHDSDNFLKTLNTPPFSYLTEKRLRNYLIKQLSNNNQQLPSKSTFKWTHGVGAVWKQEVISNSRIFQKEELSRLEQLEVKPTSVIAWLLYTHSQDGKSIKHPNKFVLSRFSEGNGQHPSPGMGYDRLAALGPKKLQTLLRNCELGPEGLILKRKVSGYEDWQACIDPATEITKIRDLAEILGLGYSM
ncbi:MAG: hypothetical protein DWQ07_17740 [Chloroflexi bacterium]|nr:MAG: hypothetical protein DWQ07_17740 [Chloroflexota bacterium]